MNRRQIFTFTRVIFPLLLLASLGIFSFASTSFSIVNRKSIFYKNMPTIFICDNLNTRLHSHTYICITHCNINTLKSQQGWWGDHLIAFLHLVG